MTREEFAALKDGDLVYVTASRKVYRVLGDARTVTQAQADESRDRAVAKGFGAFDEAGTWATFNGVRAGKLYGPLRTLDPARIARVGDRPIVETGKCAEVARPTVNPSVQPSEVTR